MNLILFRVFFPTWCFAFLFSLILTLLSIGFNGNALAVDIYLCALYGFSSYNIVKCVVFVWARVNCTGSGFDTSELSIPHILSIFSSVCCFVFDLKCAVVVAIICYQIYGYCLQHARTRRIKYECNVFSSKCINNSEKERQKTDHNMNPHIIVMLVVGLWSSLIHKYAHRIILHITSFQSIG